MPGSRDAVSRGGEGRSSTGRETMRQVWRCVLIAFGRLYWLAHEIRPLYTLKGHKDSINAMAFLSDEQILAFSPTRWLFASGSVDGTVIPWDVESGFHLSRLPIACFTWEALSPEGGKTLGSTLHREPNSVRCLQIHGAGWGDRGARVGLRGRGAVDAEGQKSRVDFHRGGYLHRSPHCYR